MNQFNTIRPLFRVPVKYGFFGALLGILVIVLLYATDKHPLLIPPMLDFRIILFGLFIFFGLKEFRDYHNENILNFWQGMIISFIIYMTIAFLVALFIVLFASLVPEFLEEYILGTIKGLELEKSRLVTEGTIKITEEEFQRQITLLRQSTPPLLALDYIIKSCFIGFPIAIILSVILRKTEKRFS